MVCFFSDIAHRFFFVLSCLRLLFLLFALRYVFYIKIVYRGMTNLQKVVAIYNKTANFAFVLV